MKNYERPKVSKEQFEEHIERVKWNEEACKNLGFNFRRDSRQVLTMTIEQGTVQIFHEWSSFKDQNTIFNMHKMAELALKKYITMLKENGYKLPGVWCVNK
jgi:hypothetical protein